MIRINSAIDALGILVGVLLFGAALLWAVENPEKVGTRYDVEVVTCKMQSFRFIDNKQMILVDAKCDKVYGVRVELPIASATFEIPTPAQKGSYMIGDLNEHISCWLVHKTFMEDTVGWVEEMIDASYHYDPYEYESCYII